jgi:hypothetical protein
MSINVEVSKTGSESALATIRKFSRKVQGTGLVKTVRKGRYFARDASKIVKKKRALKLLKRRAEYHKLVKEGKIAEAPVRRTPYSRGPGQNESSSQTRPAEGTSTGR